MTFTLVVMWALAIVFLILKYAAWSKARTPRPRSVLSGMREMSNDNVVARLALAHPGLQPLWFTFVAAVAVTVGVLSESNSHGLRRNVFGGIAFFVFGGLALGLAVRAWRRRGTPHRKGNSG